MADKNDWTIAIGCRKAVVQMIVRLPIALGVCWGGFWALQKFVLWMEGQIGREITRIDQLLILAVAMVAGIAAGQILSRGFSGATGLIGNHLLGPTCVLLLIGLWQLHRIVRVNYAEWAHIAFWLFLVIAINACVTAWWQFSQDS
jgi:hypothetical protein